MKNQSINAEEQSALGSFRGAGSIITSRPPGVAKQADAWSRNLAKPKLDTLTSGASDPAHSVVFTHVVFAPRRAARISQTLTHVQVDVALGGRVDWYFALCSLEATRVQYRWAEPGAYFHEALSFTPPSIFMVPPFKHIHVLNGGPLVAQDEAPPTGVPQHAGVFRHEIPADATALCGTYTWCWPHEGMFVGEEAGQSEPFLPLLHSFHPTFNPCIAEVRFPILRIVPQL